MLRAVGPDEPLYSWAPQLPRKIITLAFLLLFGSFPSNAQMIFMFHHLTNQWS